MDPNNMRTLLHTMLEALFKQQIEEMIQDTTNTKLQEYIDKLKDISHIFNQLVGKFSNFCSLVTSNLWDLKNLSAADLLHKLIQGAQLITQVRQNILKPLIEENIIPLLEKIQNMSLQERETYQKQIKEELAERLLQLLWNPLTLFMSSLLALYPDDMHTNVDPQKLINYIHNVIYLNALHEWQFLTIYNVANEVAVQTVTFNVQLVKSQSLYMLLQAVMDILQLGYTFSYLMFEPLRDIRSPPQETMQYFKNSDLIREYPTLKVLLDISAHSYYPDCKFIITDNLNSLFVITNAHPALMLRHFNAIASKGKFIKSIAEFRQKHGDPFRNLQLDPREVTNLINCVGH